MADQERNARGDAIAASAQARENFWRWYAGSRVVDYEGRPKVLFHGTTRDFQGFRISSSGNFGAGVYLTEEAQTANCYADYEGGLVVPVYMRLVNPFMVSADYEVGEQEDLDSPSVPLVRALFGEGGRADTILSQMRCSDDPRLAFEVWEELARRGHDGIIARYPDGCTEYVALTPNQVKSAIGNSGAFNPRSASLVDQPGDRDDVLALALASSLALAAGRGSTQCDDEAEDQEEVLAGGADRPGAG